jgi:hypothetical protein
MPDLYRNARLLQSPRRRRWCSITASNHIARLQRHLRYRRDTLPTNAHKM